MDPTLLACLVTLLILVILAGTHFWTKARRQRGDLAKLPARVTNPRLHLNVRSVRLWQLRVETPAKACNWAQESAGRRFATATAVPVPIAGCGKACRCQYFPVADGRRLGQSASPSIDPLEFERLTPGEAKPADRRRKDSFWSGGRSRH